MPTMPATDGWTFSWSVSYTETGATTPVTMTLANAANFTMPDGPFTIVGVWSRNGHNVAFRSDSTPGMGGTVTVKAPATMPFTRRPWQDAYRRELDGQLQQHHRHPRLRLRLRGLELRGR